MKSKAPKRNASTATSPGSRPDIIITRPSTPRSVSCRSTSTPSILIRASRIAIGHAEGLFGAFGNIYRDLAEIIRARTDQSAVDPLALAYPAVEQGIEGVRAIHAAARSASRNGAWIEL